MPRFEEPATPNTLPAVARAKAERPKAVPAPELGDGQSKRLSRSREERGWSLRDLAAASGVSARTIHAIENGTSRGAASCMTMARLADALHVPRGWLAFGG